MKFRSCALVILLSASFSFSASAENIRIQSNEPGNLFYVKEQIDVTISPGTDGGKPAVSLTVFLHNGENVEMDRKKFPVPDEDDPVIRYKPDDPPPGYYTCSVDVTYSGGSEKSSFLKLAVIRKPRDIFSPENNPFAVDAFLSWRCESEEAMKNASLLMKKAGIRWVRDRISWNHVQESPTEWGWSRYDPSQEIQSDHDLRILQVLQDTAVWASEKKTGETETRKKYPPSDLRDYYNFTSEAARRYRDEVHAWEMWNEFDIPVFFLGEADEYAAVLKAGSIGVRDGNPSAQILSGSVTLGSGLITWGDESYFDEEGIRYIEKVMENGAGGYFDVFNVHHYGPVEGVTGKIRQCRAIMKKYDCQKPLWLTEMGVTASEKLSRRVTTLEEEQASYLVKAYTLALSGGVDKFFFFSLPDFIEHGSSFWGVLEQKNDSWRPKPGFAALSNLIYTLDGMRYCGRYETYMPVEAHVFRRDSEGCMVMWSRDGEKYKPSVFFKEKQKNPVLRTLYGRDHPRRNVMVGTVQVESQPAFLVNFDYYELDDKHITSADNDFFKNTGGASLSEAEKVILRIKTASDFIDVFTQDIEGHIDLYNFSINPMKGDVKLELSYPGVSGEIVLEERVDLSSMERKKIPFRIGLSKQVKKSFSQNLKKELKLKAVFNDDNSEESSSPAVRYLSFVPPVDISHASLMNVRAPDPVTTITLTNRLDKTLKAWIEMKPDACYRCETTSRCVELSGNESVPVSFAMTPAFQSRETADAPSAEVHVRAGGVDMTKTTYLEFNGLPQTFMPLEIDGKPGGWNYFIPFSLEGEDRVVHGMDLLERGGDIRGRVYAAWDEKNLYLFALIQDEDVVNSGRAKNPWTGDALEIFLDVRPPEKIGTPEYSENVYQVFVVPPDEEHPEPAVLPWQPEDTEWSGVHAASAVYEDAYTLELMIPWNNLTSHRIQPGMEIGMEFTIDDYDAGDYAHRQIVWRGSTNNWRDPSQFSRMTLIRHQRRGF